MKKIIALTIAAMMLILSFSSCELNFDNVNDIQNGGQHIHIFTKKFDDEWHFMECSCGEIKDKTAHGFEWVVDIEPTYTSTGLKHRECNECGHKIDEGTVTERLIHEETINGGNSTQPSFSMSQYYTDFTELNDFFISKEIIKGSFLSLDLSSSEENKIHVQNPFGDPSYCLFYERQANDQYANPILVTEFSIYSEELGSDTDADVLFHSFTLKMVSTPQNSFSEKMSYEFFPYEKQGEIWNYVVKIYSGNECVAEMYYYTILDIDREWIVSFLSEYIRRV